PYASYLDWSKVDTAAAKTLSTIWYRTQTAGNAYTFDTYNGSGNVSTNLGATKVTNLIPPMQAFWVRVKQGESGGTLTFTNAMRAHGDYSTNIFKAPSAKTTTRQLVRLEVSTDVNRDETLIYFNENASNGYDAFDSPKMSNGSASIPEIYTNAGNEKLVINGMKNVTDDIELSLGFTTGQANSFSIKASEVTNLNDVDIILKDKLLNKEFNLLSGDTYSFTSDVVTTDLRFAVLFKTRSVNTALEPVSNGAKVYARANKGRITFINGNEPGVIIPVVIYNNAGQQVSNFNLNQSKTMLADRFAPGVYVVSFKSKQGISTQKIIVD
ncbi:MAG TPA: T9SS type A sorting domain-containing protein, partial [Paludibacter sp.]